MEEIDSFGSNQIRKRKVAAAESILSDEAKISQFLLKMLVTDVFMNYKPVVTKKQGNMVQTVSH